MDKGEEHKDGEVYGLHGDYRAAHWLMHKGVGELGMRLSDEAARTG